MVGRGNYTMISGGGEPLTSATRQAASFLNLKLACWLKGCKRLHRHRVNQSLSW